MYFASLSWSSDKIFYLFNQTPQEESGNCAEDNGGITLM